MATLHILGGKNTNLEACNLSFVVILDHSLEEFPGRQFYKAEGQVSDYRRCEPSVYSAANTFFSVRLEE